MSNAQTTTATDLTPAIATNLVPIGIPYARRQRIGTIHYALCPICNTKIALIERKDFESYTGSEYADHYAAKHGPDAPAAVSEIDVSGLLAAGFSIAALKTWNGMEGMGYQFKLVYKSPRTMVAFVTDAGRGGDIEIEWGVMKADRFQARVSHKGEILIHDQRLTPRAKNTLLKKMAVVQEARTAALAIADAHPGLLSQGMELDVDLAFTLDELVNWKQLSDKLRRSACFRAPGQSPREYHMLNGPINEANRAWILKSYPGAVILNDITPTAPF